MDILSVPRILMREGPSFETKVVSEALFGERIRVLQTNRNFVEIQTPDHYSGWIPVGTFLQRKRPYEGDVEVTRLAAHVYPKEDTEFGPVFTLPFGSSLKVLSKGERWVQIVLPDDRIAFIQKGDVETDPFDLFTFSQKFLGLPYTWGGRSSFGFDCSGFVQMLYSRLGIQLPRDSKQQIALGEEVFTFRLGDLIFWGHSEDEIRHVGMFLEGETFIHASARENKPYLRLSKLSDAEWCGKGFYPFRTARRICEVQNSKEKRHSETRRTCRSARV